MLGTDSDFDYLACVHFMDYACMDIMEYGQLLICFYDHWVIWTTCLCYLVEFKREFALVILRAKAGFKSHMWTWLEALV